MRNRAKADHQAGAEAVLIHSKIDSCEEIESFMREWGNRGPIVIVPTKYYKTPTQTFRDLGICLVIWANHLMRSAISAMRQTAMQIYDLQSLHAVEDRIATLAEVFELQNADELQQAEKRYLPPTAEHSK